MAGAGACGRQVRIDATLTDTWINDSPSHYIRQCIPLSTCVSCISVGDDLSETDDDTHSHCSVCAFGRFVLNASGR